MDLFEEDPTPEGVPPGNQPEFTVTELAGAVKRVIEGEFGLVRVRGEIGRVSRPASGHMYFDLKDDRSVIAAISWKGQVAKMQVRPEEGMEVVATGKMTTFPGQSKYQLIVDDIAPAGAGALMAMLEKRRAALQAEGLFDPARKQPIPYLPQVIGVVTSPSGAVIRDILHRLRDRFPRHVLVWPVAVQGQNCAAEVAAAIRGFNDLAPGGPIPRPDLLIVARGGGSLEDLWGFNEEIVVRAAAASRIPLISAVGHETDTTLIDFASDRRAPTPTAAAEMAVPVRFELLSMLDTLATRQGQAVGQAVLRRQQRLRDLSRALPRPEALLANPSQRLDAALSRLSGGLSLAVSRKRSLFERGAARLSPQALLNLTAQRGAQVSARGEALEARLHRMLDARRAGFDKWASRLGPSLSRLVTDAGRRQLEGQAKLGLLSQRLDAAPALRLRVLSDRLEALDRTRQTLGYAETLRRGYAVIRAEGHVITSRVEAETAAALEVEFHDGRLTLGVATGGDAPVAVAEKPAVKAPKRAAPKKPPEQGSLF